MWRGALRNPATRQCTAFANALIRRIPPSSTAEKRYSSRVVMRAPRLQKLRETRAPLCRALGLVASCYLLLAGCGKDTQPQLAPVGSSDAGGGAGDTGGSDAVAAGGRDATAGENGSAGESEAAANAGAGGASAGDSGSAGGSAESTRPDGCLDRSHFEDTMRTRWDLHVVGTGFDADEGSRVRLVVTFNGQPSYGLSETTIQNGSFDFLMQKAVEPYTGMGVYVDKNRDDACTLGVDALWQRTTGGVPGDYLWELTPDQRQPAGASPCNINGIFDLTVPLPCP